MNIPEFVLTILKRLQGSGYQAYIVGGALRDMCLNRPITDWDVATSAPPDEIRNLFGDIRNFSLNHGTVTLVADGGQYEVTTFRGSKDSGNTLDEDLSHRDFTIDAMAYDAEKGILLDLHGGEEDILKKFIRAVGDPKARFSEDPLRLLRAIRLFVELGFKIERDTLKIISLMADRIGLAAQERIRDELMKILMSQRPSRGFNLMVRTGLLKQVLPELLEGHLKRQDSPHRYTIFRHIMETVDNVEPKPVLRLAALLHDIAKPRVRIKKDGQFCFSGYEQVSADLAREMMKRLRFSNEITERVTHLIVHHMDPVGYDLSWSDGAVRKVMRRVGPENMNDLLAFRHADILAHGMEDDKMPRFLELKKRVATLAGNPIVTKRCHLAIDGHKIMAVLGMPPGPEIGRILEGLMDRVTEAPELNAEKRLVALLKGMKETGIC
ncbi:MAG: CCA tRNA nucleotidyltransferase [Pseudomonadota bacterium]